MSSMIPDRTQSENAQQIYALTQQLADLQNTIATIQSGSGQGAITPGSSGGNSTAITNLINNGDWSFDDGSYNGNTYAAASIRPADWYCRPAATATVMIESAGAVESTESMKLIKWIYDAAITVGTKILTCSATFDAGDVGSVIAINGAGAAGAVLFSVIDVYTNPGQVTIHDNALTTVNSAGSGPYARAYPAGSNTGWNQRRGVVEFGNGDSFEQPLSNNWAQPGLGLFVQFLARLNPDAGVNSITSTHRLRVSIWDNTAGQLKIITGGTWKPTAALIAGAGGSTRKYVIEVVTPVSSYFSETVTPTTVTGCPVVTSGSPGQVQISFQAFNDAIAYRVHRSDSDDSDPTKFHMIQEIDTGATTAFDLGGRPGPAETLTNVFPTASATIVNFGAQAGTDWIPFICLIRVPNNYNQSVTTGKQWLRFDILDSTNTPVAIPVMGLMLDKIGMSFQNGAWQPSAGDLTTSARITSSFADPAIGGVGQDPGFKPGDGGGGPNPFQGGE